MRVRRHAAAGASIVVVACYPAPECAGQAAFAPTRARPPAAATRPPSPRLQSKAGTDASERHETAGGCEQGATLGLEFGALRFQVSDLPLQGVPFRRKVIDLCSRRAHGTLGESSARTAKTKRTSNPSRITACERGSWDSCEASAGATGEA